jgi:hypothetical protein
MSSSLPVFSQYSFNLSGVPRHMPLPLVNEIRPRVKAWHAAGWPGASGITKKLLEHWHDAEQRDLALRLAIGALNLGSSLGAGGGARHLQPGRERRPARGAGKIGKTCQAGE